MVVILQIAKCHRNQRTDSLGQGDTWESGIATVTEKEVCIPFDAVGPIMIMPYRCNAVYTPLFNFG